MNLGGEEFEPSQINTLLQTAEININGGERRGMHLGDHVVASACNIKQGVIRGSQALPRVPRVCRLASRKGVGRGRMGSDIICFDLARASLASFAATVTVKRPHSKTEKTRESYSSVRWYHI